MANTKRLHTLIRKLSECLAVATSEVGAMAETLGDEEEVADNIELWRDVIAEARRVLAAGNGENGR